MLSVIATPIGNLKDITIHALEKLKSADIILCEDTRNTKKLLNHYQINKPLLSYHQHSKLTRFYEIYSLLKENKHLALVSDAGSPGISDPGNQLIQFLTKKLPDLKIETIPGPSALTAAISISGFSMDKFLFFGFLPHKKGRLAKINEILNSNYPVVLFESPYRIIKTLEEIKNLSSYNPEIFVARELTKQFETSYRGNIEEVIKKIKNDKIKGEFVIIINNKSNNINK